MISRLTKPFKENSASPQFERKVLLLLIIISFIIRTPFLSLPLDRDVGIHVVIAENLSKGLLSYRDIFDHKPPGIHFALFLLSKVAPLNLFSISLFTLIVYIANMICVYLLTKKL